MNNATEYAKALYELVNTIHEKEELLKDLGETLKVFSGDTLKDAINDKVLREGSVKIL